MVAVHTDLQRGDQIAGCTLLEKVGFGGESVVWSGVYASISHPVIIRLTPIDGVDMHEAANLVKQAQILTTLEHSHVLPVYDTGLTSGFFYTVSRYCANGSLDQMMKKRRLSTVEVLLFAMQIALALNYVHNYNIVHRDLKPANILLDINHHAYLTDFGLAEQLITGKDAPHHTSHGTAPYVPPEHRLGEEVSRTADIYSFGIMLFEMLKGHLPWHGERALHQFQIREPNSILPPLPSAYPIDVHRVLTDMTRADPGDRIQSALDAYLKLYTAFDSPDIRSTGARPSTKDVALTLILRGRQNWMSKPAQFPLRLTDMAYIDSQIDNINRKTYPDLAAFMLHGALTYGYRVEYWWNELQHVYGRMEICERVLLNEIDPTAALLQLQTMEADYLYEHLSQTTWGIVKELAHEPGPSQRSAAKLLTMLERS